MSGGTRNTLLVTGILKLAHSSARKGPGTIPQHKAGGLFAQWPAKVAEEEQYYMYIAGECLSAPQVFVACSQEKTLSLISAANFWQGKVLALWSH